ncbi:hypothetical protein NQZ68_017950 [Dissostichus eleginoides]|nr:hypothetical protein NQZ68_017950 [Dissostichus eleginoides]
MSHEGEETKVINTAQSSQAAAGAWQSDKNRRVSVLPLAGAFNRQWHLSPRAVMSSIHQWGMTGYMPPPLTTEVGGEGSHSTRPERWKGVCAVECDTHGHWVWTLNHRGLVCMSHPSFFNPYSTFYTSPGGLSGPVFLSLFIPGLFLMFPVDLLPVFFVPSRFSAAKWVLVCEEHISWLCGCLLLPLPGDRAWARLVFTQQSDSVKSSKALKVSLHQRPEPIRADTTLPSPHGRAAVLRPNPPPPPPLPSSPSLRISRSLLLPCTHNNAASAKKLLPSALVEACCVEELMGSVNPNGEIQNHDNTCSARAEASPPYLFLIFLASQSSLQPWVKLSALRQRARMREHYPLPG